MKLDDVSDWEAFIFGLVFAFILVLIVGLTI